MRLEPRWRDRLALARVALVLVLLLWLLGQMRGSVDAGSLDWRTLLVALAVNEACLVLFALRMRLLVAAYAIPLGRLDAFRIHLQSMFYFFVLPMTVGLEVARFAKIRARRPASSVAALTTALLLDRIVGALAAALVAILALPWTALRKLPPLPDPWSMGVAAAGLGIVLAVALGASRRWLRRIVGMLAPKWRTLAAALLISIGTHAVFAVAIYIVFSSVAPWARYADVLFAVSAGMLLMAVPLSLGGFGPADLGVGALAVALGYPTSLCAFLGALPYVARLVAGLQGGVWEMAEASLAASRLRRLRIVRAAAKSDRHAA